VGIGLDVKRLIRTRLIQDKMIQESRTRETLIAENLIREDLIPEGLTFPIRGGRALEYEQMMPGISDESVPLIAVPDPPFEPSWV
jgi:hypothetical protein